MTNMNISTNKIQLPFWFGNEDSMHIKEILNLYSKFIKLNKDRSPNSREPIKFIGRVKRTLLRDKCLQTLDEISIFRKLFVQIGTELPIVCKLLCITKWDPHDGLPYECIELRESDLKYFKDSMLPITSYLYCLPEFSCFENAVFRYHVSKEETAVGFADPISKVLQKCIPPRNDEEIEEEEDDDDLEEEEDDDDSLYDDEGDGEECGELEEHFAALLNPKVGFNFSITISMEICK